MAKRRKPGGRTPRTKPKWLKRGLSFENFIPLAFLILLSVATIAPTVFAKGDQSQETPSILKGQIQQEVVAQSFPFERRWPTTGEISQSFSRRHKGVDIRSDFGKSVYPFGPGIVEYAGWMSGFGKVVLVKHKEGYSSLYAHLGKTKVREGEPVGHKKELGTVGLTGWTTGAHLHLEIYENGEAIDPESILPETPDVSLAKF